MLEDKLRNVKNEVVKRLEQGELVQQDYFKAVHELLEQEGLAKGEYATDNLDLAISVGEGIRTKIEAEMHNGLNNTYVALKDKELSIEAEHDVRSLNSLIEYAGRHVRQQAQGKPIMEADFHQMIKDYISSQKLIPITDNYARAGATGYAIGRLSREFDVINEPVKYGGIDKHELREAIERL